MRSDPDQGRTPCPHGSFNAMALNARSLKDDPHARDRAIMVAHHHEARGIADPHGSRTQTIRTKTGEPIKISMR
jgi:hypothetical protein